MEQMIGKPEKVQMGKMKSPKSSEPTNSAEIIINNLKQNGLDQKNAEKAIVGLQQQIKAGRAKILQIAKTVFVILPKPDMSAEFVIYTVEPNEISSRIKSLSKSLKEMGFRRAFVMSLTPNSKQIAEKTGMPVKVTQTTMMRGNEMVPAYRYEVTL